MKICYLIPFYGLIKCIDDGFETNTTWRIYFHLFYFIHITHEFSWLIKYGHFDLYYQIWQLL